MEIIEYRDTEHSALEAFKASVWPAADAEHYADTQPDFYKKEITLLAKQGDDIVGYCTLIADSGIAQIEPLMVAVDKKGQGIGTILIKAAEEKAREMGIHKIWLETGDTWKAKDFYIKSGFTIRTVLPNHTGHQDFILFDKML